MSFLRTWSVIIFYYYLKGLPDHRVSQVQELGIPFGFSLNFRPHINYTTANASLSPGIWGRILWAEYLFCRSILSFIYTILIIGIP